MTVCLSSATDEVTYVPEPEDQTDQASGICAANGEATAQCTAEIRRTATAAAGHATVAQQPQLTRNAERH